MLEISAGTCTSDVFVTDTTKLVILPFNPVVGVCQVTKADVAVMLETVGMTITEGTIICMRNNRP
jgi:hypothetical protein